MRERDSEYGSVVGVSANTHRQKITHTGPALGASTHTHKDLGKGNTTILAMLVPRTKIKL